MRQTLFIKHEEIDTQNRLIRRIYDISHEKLTVFGNNDIKEGFVFQILWNVTNFYACVTRKYKLKFIYNILRYRCTKSAEKYTTLTFHEMLPIFRNDPRYIRKDYFYFRHEEMKK